MLKRMSIPVAINAPPAVVPIRTLQNLAINPHFGGEVSWWSASAARNSFPSGCCRVAADDSVVRMQDEAFDSFGAIVETIMDMADARLAVLNQRRRETCPVLRFLLPLAPGSFSEPRMPGIGQKLLKRTAADVNQTGMIATLQINLRLVRQAIVDNDLEPICGTERRHSTWFTVDKERFNLLLIGHIHIGSELLAELVELDVTGGR
jgi:hypothetical protein